MEYITIPAPQKLTKLVNPANGQPLDDSTLTFSDFLGQIVWPKAVWRASKDAIEAKRRLRSAIDAAKPGEEIECRKKDHELLLAEMQKLELGAHLTDALDEFVYALMCSRQEPKAAEAKALNGHTIQEAAPAADTAP